MEDKTLNPEIEHGIQFLKVYSQFLTQELENIFDHVRNGQVHRLKIFVDHLSAVDNSSVDTIRKASHHIFSSSFSFQNFIVWFSKRCNLEDVRVCVVKRFFHIKVLLLSFSVYQFIFVTYDCFTKLGKIIQPYSSLFVYLIGII